MIGLSLRLSVSLLCGTCGHRRPTDDEAAINLAFFGAANPYTCCPVCFQEVGKKVEADPEYRRKVRVWFYENKGVVLK